MLQKISDAIKELNPDLIWGLPASELGDDDTEGEDRGRDAAVTGHVYTVPPHTGNTYADLDWHSVPESITAPTQSEIETKLSQMNSTEAMRLLRVKRDSLIAETDWWASSDLTMTSEQTAYRQALRDLPSTATPTLDSEGELDESSVTWPTKP